MGRVERGSSTSAAIGEVEVKDTPKGWGSEPSVCYAKQGPRVFVEIYNYVAICRAHGTRAAVKPPRNLGNARDVGLRGERVNIVVSPFLLCLVRAGVKRPVRDNFFTCGLP